MSSKFNSGYFKNWAEQSLWDLLDKAMVKVNYEIGIFNMRTEVYGDIGVYQRLKWLGWLQLIHNGACIMMWRYELDEQSSKRCLLTGMLDD